MACGGTSIPLLGTGKTDYVRLKQMAETATASVPTAIAIEAAAGASAAAGAEAAPKHNVAGKAHVS